MFTGECPCCGSVYIPIDQEVGHYGATFEVIVEGDHLKANIGELINQVCESCHTAGHVRRTVTRN